MRHALSFLHDAIPAPRGKVYPAFTESKIDWAFGMKQSSLLSKA
jgi:hypothetical protein